MSFPSLFAERSAHSPLAATGLTAGPRDCSRACTSIFVRAGWLLLLSAAGISLGSAQQFTLSDRWSQYLYRTYSPARLASLAAETALDHAMLEPHCWDYSADSYGRRLARAFERRVIKNTTEFGLGALTGEDLRYRPSQSHSIPARAWNAVQSSLTARMPDGSRRPAYTRFVANAVANVSTAHFTRQPVQAGWLMESVAWSALDQAQTNLLNEFGPDLRRVGGRIWNRARPHWK